jgi:hypothetical protein
MHLLGMQDVLVVEGHILGMEAMLHAGVERVGRRLYRGELGHHFWLLRVALLDDRRCSHGLFPWREETRRGEVGLPLFKYTDLWVHSRFWWHTARVVQV